ncbi:Malate/L-lactate dehydrogenase [Trematosphaeria pertusa]|uniref:Malate/L-lactate dehydrogenase n=1 Tax=Trematosphaeria pertusa TaxID=390896 RepID=A0A6A6IZ33_9PLEO|nr:Malate/L-lactate dehydrogenase [Trematosphaeria pertusa]KAF2255172.1 Malate/L-lactate dehydrogenase [Trematosphaeria pertusa]
MADSEGKLCITSASAHVFITSVLAKFNVPKDRAETMADALVQADLRGVDTHGINRLSGYIDRVRTGVLDPSPDLAFVMKTPVIAHLDAKNTFGMVAASLAIDKASAIADTYGIGLVAVKHSNHYGMAATYLLRAMKRGFAAIAFTNAARSMPAWGSKEPLLGTSPFAVGVPGGEMGDFVLDMSPSVAARGKIRKAARRGEKIPEGYALDAEGKPTTDPEAALEGTVLPIGGPKGSGLAMMMDIFGGVISGAAFAGGVNDQYKNLKEPQNVGHWFIVFRPDVFLAGGAEELRARMDTLMRTVRQSEKAAGVDRIWTSGEIEANMQMQREAEGIPFTRGEVEALHALADGIGVNARLETIPRYHEARCTRGV